MIASLAAAAIVAATLAACGGGDDEQATDDTTAATTTGEMESMADLSGVKDYLLDHTGQLTGFTDLGGFPMSTTVDNGIVGIFPIDILSWTKSTNKAATTLTSAARESGIAGPMILRLTGNATPLARKNLTALGWTIEENAGD